MYRQLKIGNYNIKSYDPYWSDTSCYMNADILLELPFDRYKSFKLLARYNKEDHEITFYAGLIGKKLTDFTIYALQAVELDNKKLKKIAKYLHCNKFTAYKIIFHLFFRLEEYI